MLAKKRLNDIQPNKPINPPRKFSKGLKELEFNGMLIRKVYDITPISVEYELSKSGKSITEVLDKMIGWGIKHRESVMSK